MKFASISERRGGRRRRLVRVSVYFESIGTFASMKLVIAQRLNIDWTTYLNLSAIELLRAVSGSGSQSVASSTLQNLVKDDVKLRTPTSSLRYSKGSPHMVDFGKMRQR